VIGALRRPPMLAVLLAYFLFAAGYIIYGTFYVAYLRAAGVDEAQAGQIWGVVGVLAIVSGALWGAGAARFPGRPLLVLAFLIEAASLIGPIVAPSPAVYYASAAAYGVTVFGIPTILMSFTRTAVDPARIPHAVGLFTVVFSVGQMLGPAAAGVVIDRSGAIGPALILGAGILIAAAASLVPFLGADRPGRG
jgi:predicted MFS family arabinose efflux permease